MMILGYCRCSTEEQADGTTLEEQERKLRGLAQIRGASPYDFAAYVDRGVSGATPLGERPQGARLLADADSGDVVCAAKLDRLFRSASDALSTVEVLQKRGVKVILLDIAAEPVTDNGVAKLFFTILSAVAEFERGRIHERVIDGMKAKRARGGHLGGQAPYGYIVRGSEREATLEVNPQEQEVVALVKDMVQTVQSPWQIARFLNQNGYRTRTGVPFHVTQVKRIAARVTA